MSEVRGSHDASGLFLRGVCMGAADVVPGVSGGTMAFILGIYEELVDSIRNVARPPLWRALLGGRIGEAFAAINGRFLVAVGAGILTAVLSLARGISWLLRNEPVLLWSFFFGLVLASVLVVGQRIPRWTPALWGALALGTVVAFWLVGLVPAQTTEAAWFIFLSGALAICAMILPGISGSYILLILSTYFFILNALKGFLKSLVSLELPVTQGAYVVVFCAGCAIGLLSFARVLSYLLREHAVPTLGVLVGLMVGCLRGIWPFRATIDGVVTNVAPTGADAIIGALATFFVGLAIVAAFTWVGRSRVDSMEAQT